MTSIRVAPTDINGPFPGGFPVKMKNYTNEGQLCSSVFTNEAGNRKLLTHINRSEQTFAKGPLKGTTVGISKDSIPREISGGRKEAPSAISITKTTKNGDKYQFHKYGTPETKPMIKALKVSKQAFIENARQMGALDSKPVKNVLKAITHEIIKLKWVKI